MRLKPFLFTEMEFEEHEVTEDGAEHELNEDGAGGEADENGLDCKDEQNANNPVSLFGTSFKKYVDGEVSVDE